MAKHRDKAWYDAELARLDALIRAGGPDEALALAGPACHRGGRIRRSPWGRRPWPGCRARLHAARCGWRARRAIWWPSWAGRRRRAPGSRRFALAQFTADERAGRSICRCAGAAPAASGLIGSLPRPPALAAWRDRCAARGREYLLGTRRRWPGSARPITSAYHAMLAAGIIRRGDCPLSDPASAGRSIWTPISTPIRAAAISATICPRMGSALAEDVPRVTGRGPVLLTNADFRPRPGIR